jgi:hypothetical protein
MCQRVRALLYIYILLFKYVCVSKYLNSTTTSRPRGCKSVKLKKNGGKIGENVFREKEASNHLSFFLSFFLTSPQSAMSTWDLKASVLMRAFSSLPAYSCRVLVSAASCISSGDRVFS